MTPENGKQAAGEKAPRHRSPNYPGISLKTASEKITGWFAKDGHVAAIKDAAIKQMGGDPGRVASALKSFGLVSEENGRIKLTQRGLEIAARKAEDPKRKQALKDAALSPTIYRDLVGLYTSGLPSDPTLESELITEKHFNKNYVGDFIRDFRETLEIAGISAATVVESKVDGDSDKKPPEIKVGDYVQWTSEGIDQFTVPRRVLGFLDDGEWVHVEGSQTGLPVSELSVFDPPTPPGGNLTPEQQRSQFLKPLPPTPPPAPGIKQDVFSIGEGEITVRWPSSLSADSFEDVSAWLDILKRKIGRSVVKPDQRVNIFDTDTPPFSKDEPE
jgi:hypothetical protein